MLRLVSGGQDCEVALWDFNTAGEEPVGLRCGVRRWLSAFCELARHSKQRLLGKPCGFHRCGALLIQVLRCRRGGPVAV